VAEAFGQDGREFVGRKTAYAILFLRVSDGVAKPSGHRRSWIKDAA
jgi:hypothetical protein